MKKKKYKVKGVCIWCMKSEPDVAFLSEPHTISKRLSTRKIGFDICDSCNHYFGTVDKSLPFPIAVELAYKEIFNLMKFIFKGLNENTHKEFKSIYFNYHHSKNVIEINNNFKLKPSFIYSLTRQFKKGLYEIFLQEYHRATQNGLDERFNEIRDFVRYNKGDLPIYYLENNGVYLIQQNIDDIYIGFTEKQKFYIDTYGFFPMVILSNFFFLEVTKRAEISREVFLYKESRKIIGSGFVYKSLRELKTIMDIDFTLRKLYEK